jgi:glycosyltransferase involved in cell wall biosynthesis
LITTVVPTYRRPGLLHRAIKSVLAQTYPNFCLIVYDNASGDETESVVREVMKHDSRVMYIQRSENIGVWRNFDDAMRRVCTTFFSFLSDDDVVLPCFFELALGGFTGNPAAGFSATTTLEIDPRGRVPSAHLLGWRPGVYPPPEGVLAMLEHGQPAFPGVLFRRKVLDEVGFLDETVGNPWDWDLELRIAARFPIVVSREPGALFSIHAQSISSYERVDDIFPAWAKVLEKLRKNEDIPPPLRSRAAQLLHHRIRERLYRGALRNIVHGEWSEAEKAIAVLNNHFDFGRRVGVLRTLFLCCRCLPPVRLGLLALSNLRRSFKELKGRKKQAEFARYSKFLYPEKTVVLTPELQQGARPGCP